MALPEPLRKLVAAVHALSIVVILYIMDNTQVPLFKRLPSSLVPKNYPKYKLAKGFSLNVTYTTFLHVYSTRYKRLGGSIKVGDKAPNPDVVFSDGTKKPLLDAFRRQGRLLVLNFGSCT